MPFHRHDRTFDYVFPNPDPEKFTVGLDQRRNSPKTNQRQHQQDATEEFETRGKAFLTKTPLRNRNR